MIEADTKNAFGARYENPPVVQTNTTIQFEALNGWKIQHPGLLHEKFKVGFPKVDQSSPDESIVESFPKTPQLPTFKFEDVSKVVPQVICLSDDSTQLIKAQADRFVFGWQSKEDSPYPGFVKTSSEFCRHFESFRSFAIENHLGEIKPNMVELQYVNRFPIDEETKEDAWNIPRDLFDIDLPTAHDELSPELFTINRTFQIMKGNEIAGRLYSELLTAVEFPATPVVIFKMTARILFDRHQSVERALEFAHDHLLKALNCLTNENCRNSKWGKAND